MRVSRPSEPGYGGGATFSKAPLVLDPAELAGAGVVVLGAPVDEGVSYRPGTRFGPRAIRTADDSGGDPVRPHMLMGADPFTELGVVDHGDAEVVASDLARSHAAIRKSTLDIFRAGAFPVVLGGDHSISHATVAAVADHHGPGAVGVIHFDTHADTGVDLDGVTRLSHGTPMYHLVNDGTVRGDAFCQIGLRGYWPFPEEFEWMRGQGFRWHTLYEIDQRGIAAVTDEVIEWANAHAVERFWLSVDIDVLDPAYAPGTGTPEPGGLTTRELFRSLREIGRRVELVGMELVEVSPPYDHADITALAGHRAVLETLCGLALRRAGREPQAESPAALGRTAG